MSHFMIMKSQDSVAFHDHEVAGKRGPNMKTATFFILSWFVVLAVPGCDDATPKRRNASGTIGGAGLVDTNPASVAPATSSTAPAPVPAANAQSAAGQVPPGATAQPQPGVPAPNAQAGTVPAPNIVSEKAAPGMTGKGNYKPGVITTPISVYFQLKEQIILGHVTHAIQLFEATNGYKPRSHEEFMKEIIEPNLPATKLPTLPEGHTYRYDPKTGELMVDHPG
jgi:hypothetical protein